MLSRIADSLFWLNRYMERSDGLLRTIRTNYILLLDKEVNDRLSWQYVLDIFTRETEENIGLQVPQNEEALYRLMLDEKNVNSLKVLITKARENARGVQDHITKEVWEQVNRMYHLVNKPELSTQLKKNAVLETLDSLLDESIMYTGVVNSTMPRGPGWSFMNLGLYIERCLLTIEIAQKFLAIIDYDDPKETNILQWRPLLLSLSGYEMHLKTYRNNRYNENAVHQLLLNKEFTRSILYSLGKVDTYLKQALGLHHTGEEIALLKCFGRLHSKVQFIDTENFDVVELQNFLQELRVDLNAFSKLLSQIFFSYA